jgi:subtilisin family serine protease
MRAPRYPFYYFFILLGILILSILFWISLFSGTGNSFNSYESLNTVNRSYWNRDHIPENFSNIIPIDTTKIIRDSVNQRRIVSNLVNIAVKNTDSSIARFAFDLKEKFPSEEYEIIYLDSVIDRIQIRLPADKRVRFKQEVKISLESYNLLVWDETLFDYVKSYSDPMLSNDRANWYLEAIDITKSWEKTSGNENIVIAVIDNGFDLTHPELKGKALKPYNVIDRSKDVTPNNENHGTHVASTIVGNANNNEGLLGICPDCSFMPIKVQDKNGIMTNTYIIDAILYAVKNDASVINLSLGIQLPPFIEIPLQEQKEYITSSAKDEEEFWKDLFQFADEKNITCVLAAGNNNMLTGFDSFQRAKTTIKVGAIDQNFAKAPFSNFGNATTIYAPGVSIFGAGPNNSYEYLEGTSMAAPIVSGVIGLMKSWNPDLTNQEIISHLEATAFHKDGMKILNTQLIKLTNN